VETAESGSHALGMLLRAQQSGQPFELALVDAGLPGMDGFLLAGTILRDAALALPVVMMLSSSDLPTDIPRCRALDIHHHVTKPVSRAELRDAIARALSSTDLPARRPVRDPGACLRRLSILLAEDNPTNQKLATRLLEKRGHQITAVNNGREAVEALHQNDYDIVLMDVQMPEMDGFAATQAIREWEKDAGLHIPIIAMTAHAMKGDQEMCLSMGMDGYITKPIDSKGLENTIQQVLHSLDKARAGAL
jgi:CheY-like chemotaxis protein